MLTRGSLMPKIIDFGFSDAPDHLTFKQSAGTPGYSAPEQAGETGSDTRADIYAFGVILKEINASLPHPNRRIAAIANACCQQDPQKRPAKLADLKWKHRNTALIATTSAMAAVLVALMLTIGLRPKAVQYVNVPIGEPAKVVHDTVMITSEPNPNLIEIEKKLRGEVLAIAQRQEDILIGKFRTDTMHLHGQLPPSVRFWQEFDSDMEKEVEAYINKHISKNDADYNKVMSEAVAYMNEAKMRARSSQEINDRLNEVMADWYKPQASNQ